MVLHKTVDGMVTCSDWDELCTTFLGEGRTRYPCNYVIFTDGTDTFAQNGDTGAIDYGGPDDNGSVDGGNAAAVIQAVLDAVHALDGGLIIIKSGVYNITTTLNIYDRTRLLGTQRGTWISGTLEYDVVTFDLASGVNGISIIGTGMTHTDDEPIRNVEVGHINIKGTDDQYAFVGYYFSTLYIHDLEISGCNRAFSFINLAADDTFSDLIVKRVRIVDPGGDNIDGQLRCGSAILFDSVTLSGGVNLQFIDCRTLTFFNCVVGATSSLAIYEASWYMHNIRIENCHFEGIAGIKPIVIYGTGANPITDIHIEDCCFFNANAGIECIYLDDVSNAYVEHNDLNGDTNIVITNTCSDVVIAYNTFGTAAITDNGTNTRYKDNSGYITANWGTATFSGDGSTTAFNIAHGCNITPTHVNLEAKSAGAVGDKYWSADATNITVTFITAPPTGVNNIVIGWKGEL